MEVKQGEQSARPENCLSLLQQTSFFWSTTRAAVLPIFFVSLDFFFGSFILCQDKRKNNILAQSKKAAINTHFLDYNVLTTNCEKYWLITLP
jgi:hypothetical protein